MHDNKAGRFFTYIAAIGLVLFFLFPLVFMFVSSLKPSQQLLVDLHSWKAFVPVGDISLDNYNDVFSRVPFGRFLANSLGTAVFTVLLGLLVNSMVGFALARIEWRGRGLVMAVVLGLLILPFDVLAIPTLFLAAKLPWISTDGGLHLVQGWFNSYQVQTLPFAANAFSIFLFAQYFRSLPLELDEAARVDGASWFRIYRSVAVPLAGPAFGTVSILTFLPMWNSYLWPIMTIQEENYRPIMVGLQYFYQQNIIWGDIMAYLSLITIPVIILFFAMQRFFVASIATSGMKG